MLMFLLKNLHQLLTQRLSLVPCVEVCSRLQALTPALSSAHREEPGARRLGGQDDGGIHAVAAVLSPSPPSSGQKSWYGLSVCLILSRLVLPRLSSRPSHGHDSLLEAKHGKTRFRTIQNGDARGGTSHRRGSQMAASRRRLRG